MNRKWIDVSCRIPKEGGLIEATVEIVRFRDDQPEHGHRVYRNIGWPSARRALAVADSLKGYEAEVVYVVSDDGSVHFGITA